MVSVADGIQEAQAKNPEVQAAAKEVQAAEAEVRVSLGLYLPEIAATWMHDWQRMQNRGEPATSPKATRPAWCSPFPSSTGSCGRTGSGQPGRAGQGARSRRR